MRRQAKELIQSGEHTASGPSIVARNLYSSAVKDPPAGSPTAVGRRATQGGASNWRTKAHVMEIDQCKVVESPLGEVDGTNPTRVLYLSLYPLGELYSVSTRCTTEF